MNGSEVAAPGRPKLLPDALGGEYGSNSVAVIRVLVEAWHKSRCPHWRESREQQQPRQQQAPCRGHACTAEATATHARGEKVKALF